MMEETIITSLQSWGWDTELVFTRVKQQGRVAQVQSAEDPPADHLALKLKTGGTYPITIELIKDAVVAAGEDEWEIPSPTTEGGGGKARARSSPPRFPTSRGSRASAPDDPANGSNAAAPATPAHLRTERGGSSHADGHWGFHH